MAASHGEAVDDSPYIPEGAVGQLQPGANQSKEGKIRFHIFEDGPQEFQVLTVCGGHQTVAAFPDYTVPEENAAAEPGFIPIGSASVQVHMIHGHMSDAIQFQHGAVTESFFEFMAHPEVGQFQVSAVDEFQYRRIGEFCNNFCSNSLRIQSPDGEILEPGNVQCATIAQIQTGRGRIIVVGVVKQPL